MVTGFILQAVCSLLYWMQYLHRINLEADTGIKYTFDQYSNIWSEGKCICQFSVSKCFQWFRLYSGLAIRCTCWESVKSPAAEAQRNAPNIVFLSFFLSSFFLSFFFLSFFFLSSFFSFFLSIHYSIWPAASSNCTITLNTDRCILRFCFFFVHCFACTLL